MKSFLYLRLAEKVITLAIEAKTIKKEINQRRMCASKQKVQTEPMVRHRNYHGKI